MAKNDASRRSFLKTVLAGSTAAAVTLSGKTSEAVDTKRKQQTDEVLYRETPAFKKYYDSLR
jgi:hypothetical protein